MNIKHRIFFFIAIFITYTLAGENRVYASGSYPYMPVPDNSIKQGITYYEFDERDTQYKETELRRFEIIFFISMPVSFIFSFMSVGAYRLVTKKTGGFSSLEYQYLILSTIGISFTVALKDHRNTYKKSVF